MSNGIAHGELILFDCPRIRKSEFWQFIKLVAPSASPPEGQTHWLSQDATDAFCLKCNKMLRFTKGSSNSVRRHMERFHRKELQKRQAQTADAKRGAKPAAVTAPATSRKAKRLGPGPPDGHQLPESNSTASAAGDASDDVQALKHRRVGSAVGRDSRPVTEGLLKWLAMSLRPLSVVEDPGFEEFAQALSMGQSFTAPSREMLYHSLELMSETVRFETKQRVKKEVSSFALSVEMWQAQASSVSPTRLSDSHAVIKCLYLTDSFSPQSCTIDIVDPASLTGDKIIQIIEVSGLQLSSLATVFLENGGDIAERLKATALRCVVNVPNALGTLLETLLHCTQLPSVRSGDEDTQDSSGLIRLPLQEALSDISKILKWLQEDAAAATQFQVLHARAHVEMIKLGPSSLDSSRWGIESGHDAISRAVLLHEALDSFVDQWCSINGATDAASRQPCKPKPESWMLLEGLLLLWRPLHEIVQVTAHERICSLPFVLPIIMMAKQHFERVDLFDEIKQRYAGFIHGTAGLEALHRLRADLLLGLDRLYGLACKDLGWIAALDPRYGRLRHLTEQEREVVKEQLLLQALNLFTSQLPTESIGAIVAADFDGVMMYGDTRGVVGGGSGVGSGLMHRLLFDEDEDVAPPNDSMLTREAEIAQARLYISDEIAVYLNEHQLRKTRVACPLQWWSANRERFPFLAPLARMWLSTRAGLAPNGRPRRSTLPADVCESLGSSVDATKWFAHARNMIELHTHFAKTSSSSPISL